MRKARELLCLAALAVLAGCASPGPSRESLDQFFSDVAQEGSAGKSWTGSCWAPGAKLTMRTSDGLVMEATKENLAAITTQTVPKIKKFEVLDSSWDSDAKVAKVRVRHSYQDQPANEGLYTLKQDGGKLQIVAYEDVTLGQ